jgi:hypothetical protein
MIETVVSQPVVGTDEPSVSGVSWAAVAAGAVASLALTLVLIAFGTGIGLSVVTPWSNAGASASTFKIATGIYLVVIAMISSAIGGYLAGRLRSRWIGVHTDEVYFRDTAHGFLAWSFATVLGAILLASPATSLVSGAVSGVTAGAAAASAQGPSEGYIDTLLRPATPAPNGNGADVRGELSRLMASSLRNGEMKPADRSYLTKVVAAQAGIPEPEADKRITDVINDAKAAADAARKAAMQLAFWLTASLLIGAFSASLAATEGGGLRDGTWKKRR